MCEQNPVSGQKFALFITQKVYQKMNEIERSEWFSPEEWEEDKRVINEGITLMGNYLQNPDPELKKNFYSLIREIDNRQGDDVRNVSWGTVHFVRSGYLLKLKYALRCFTDRDFPFYVYKLAREYVEKNSGISAESVPMLLEVVEFWCQYHLEQSLAERFPDFTNS